MRAGHLVTAAALVALLPPAAASARAPAPDPSAGARQKLEELKKRLPAVIRAWAKEEWGDDPIKVRLVRQTGPDKAKITLQCKLGESHELLTIYLRFYGGLWTTTRFDATWGGGNAAFTNKAARFLMLAIDESGEK